jgi:aldehyde:ferredoxin oxidoreductase
MLCNALGSDTISAGADIALAIDCYEHGIILNEDTHGLSLPGGERYDGSQINRKDRE